MDIQSIKNRFGIIGNAPTLNLALHTAMQVAATDLSVLIIGESGVGKEAFSQVIHSLSARKHNIFIAVNCGAIPEGTIDSELFGHEKGSFTGAVGDRKGYFETVTGGTMFLDEIGEMPLGTQARLLRVLETGEFIRVGSSKVEKTNVRIIAATNRDLILATQKGKFREDLYYRLSTVPIRVPALRDRKEDIALLFHKFAVDFAERYKTPPVLLDDDARQSLIAYLFPGNVRELKNLAEQISVLHTSRKITAGDLQKFLLQKESTNELMLNPTAKESGDFANEREILYKMFFDMKKDMMELKKMFLELLQNPSQATKFKTYAQENFLQEINTQTALPSSHPMPSSINRIQNQPDAMVIHTTIQPHEEIQETLNLVEMERELIIKALKKHKGKRKESASELGISDRTLYRKIEEYNIDL